MSNNDLKRRAKSALIGLAIGDALSWPALYHRSYMLPFWTRRIRREIDAGSEETNIIRPPMPFSLNRPSEPLALGPTDDTEWAAFTATLLIEQNGDLDPEHLLRAWLELANGSARLSSPKSAIVRGGVSTQAALTNLRRGLRPPICGHDNPHYFDDGACARAVPIGVVCAGNPERAAKLAAIDACVTNAEDGLWAAQAMAAAVSVACAGGTAKEAVDAALAPLPSQSWIQRTAAKAMSLCEGTTSLFEAIPILADEIVNREYSYGTAAPETLALTLAITTLAKNDFASAVMAATAIAKTADSVPALVGALCGALSEQEIAGERWLQSVRMLRGICLPHLAGKDFLQMAESLADLAVRN